MPIRLMIIGFFLINAGENLLQGDFLMSLAFLLMTAVYGGQQWYQQSELDAAKTRRGIGGR